MKVAVFTPADAATPAAVTRGGARARSMGHHSEWSDPEGGDWLAADYPEAAGETRREAAPPGQPHQPQAEFEHWFG